MDIPVGIQSNYSGFKQMSGDIVNHKLEKFKTFFWKEKETQHVCLITWDSTQMGPFHLGSGLNQLAKILNKSKQ